MNSFMKKQFEKGRLVILLGAGASITSTSRIGGSIPLGWETSKKLVEEIGEKFNNDALKDAYEAAKASLGVLQVEKIFNELFKHCIPSNEYKELAKYRFPRIYTLNIDDAFERAFSEVNGQDQDRRLEVKRRFDHVYETDPLFQETQLIKLNGDINVPNDGYVFSTEEYAQGSVRAPVWYEEVARDYTKFTFLFIGTSMDEPLFWHQVETYKTKISGTSIQGFLIAPGLSQVKKASLNSAKINYIDGTFSDFIDWLKKEFPTPPDAIAHIKNTNPRLLTLGTGSELRKDDLFSGLIKVDRESLSKLNYEADRISKIREFYKGFKPVWSDILDLVPAFLNNTASFYKRFFEEVDPVPLNLYVVLGAAGCGKSTALKQVALRLSEGKTNTVYFLEEYKVRLDELVRELDTKNEEPYFLIIERLADFSTQISKIIEDRLSNKVMFIGAENTTLWESRVFEHLGDLTTGTHDFSEIVEHDVPLILAKIREFGNWTRLAKMTKKQRNVELYKKSKKQLLIGLMEATSGEGFNQIIKKDYLKIQEQDQKALLILAGLASTQRVPASETTLTRALEYLGFRTPVSQLCNHMKGILTYSNGNVTTRHRIYIERLFELYISKDIMLRAITSYIKAFSVYKFPIVKNISKNESSVYKNLVNAKTLKRLIGDDEKILKIYQEFEKPLENEGLFLMQYGLALRSFNKQEEAYEKLKIADLAFPDNVQIQHALAHQRIIIAMYKESSQEAIKLYEDAEEVLLRLYEQKVKLPDRYPIITMTEGKVRLYQKLGMINEAKIFAKQGANLLESNSELKHHPRVKQARQSLMNFALTGHWSGDELD